MIMLFGIQISDIKYSYKTLERDREKPSTFKNLFKLAFLLKGLVPGFVF
mgnify:CR=1 FL=1